MSARGWRLGQWRRKGELHGVLPCRILSAHLALRGLVGRIPDGWNRKREDIESSRYRRQVAKAQVLDDCREREGKHLGFFSEFATAEGEQASVKVGIFS